VIRAMDGIDANKPSGKRTEYYRPVRHTTRNPSNPKGN
jgi:hypothetical protein